MTYRELLKRTKLQLEKAGCQASQMEAYLLMEEACGVNRTKYPLVADTLCPIPFLENMAILLRRRLTGEPIQYVLGRWEFYGYDFNVGPGVLIPRAETELLVQTVLDATEEVRQPVYVDLCSGSGCIAVTLGLQRPDSTVHALEMSQEAMGYLRQNIERNKAENVSAHQEDALRPQEEYPMADAVVSNPPYVCTGELDDLQREVQFEPRMALDGDADGLHFYRLIPKAWMERLRPGGIMAFEIGCEQGAAVKALLEEYGMEDVKVLKDLAGLDRVVWGRKPQ